MSTAARPQDLVERALSVATEPCVLWVTEHAEANLRWANNALITNGEMRSRRLTVTAIAEVAGGSAAGTVTCAAWIERTAPSLSITVCSSGSRITASATLRSLRAVRRLVMSPQGRRGGGRARNLEDQRRARLERRIIAR